MHPVLGTSKDHQVMWLVFDVFVPVFDVFVLVFNVKLFSVFDVVNELRND